MGNLVVGWRDLLQRYNNNNYAETTISQYDDYAEPHTKIKSPSIHTTA